MKEKVKSIAKDKLLGGRGGSGGGGGLVKSPAGAIVSTPSAPVAPNFWWKFFAIRSN